LAARQCPNCLSMLSASSIAARSNDLVCPGCGRPLEISDFSRNLASFIGLAAAVVVWCFTARRYAHDASALGWVLPVLYSYLALSIVSPLALIALADLQQKSEAPAPAPVHHQAPSSNSSH
jgi:hypothetical protein